MFLLLDVYARAGDFDLWSVNYLYFQNADSKAAESVEECAAIIALPGVNPDDSDDDLISAK